MLYGSQSDTDPGWNVTDSAAFTPIADVDTAPLPESSLFVATSIRQSAGQPLGSFRWLIWAVTPAPETAGGENTAGIGLVEYNLAGTGMQVGLSRTSEVDRSGTEFLLHYGQAFDGWTSLHYQEGRYSDGGRRVASVTRPFYALDTRWAAGASWDDWDQTDSIYNAGNEVARFRHRGGAADVFAVSAGISNSLWNAWFSLENR